jgi:hypothetical protein
MSQAPDVVRKRKRDKKTKETQKKKNKKSGKSNSNDDHFMWTETAKRPVTTTMVRGIIHSFANAMEPWSFFMREQGKYNVGDDCPVFDGLFEFCGNSAGGSTKGTAPNPSLTPTTRSPD